MQHNSFIELRVFAENMHLERPTIIIKNVGLGSRVIMSGVSGV